MPTSAPSPQTTFPMPPTRAERTILVAPVPYDLTIPFISEGDQTDPYPGQVEATKVISALDFLQTLRTDPTNYAAGLTDYLSVTLRDRAGTGQPLIYKFLVNPATIQMNRQVVDAEALTRSGMQMGVWGDVLDISMSGQTAGQYFAGVLVD